MGNIVARTSEPGLSVALGPSVAPSGGALKSRRVATNHLLVALRKAESGAGLIIALVDTRGEARVANCCRVLSDKRVTDTPNSFRLTAVCWSRLAAGEGCQHQDQH